MIVGALGPIAFMVSDYAVRTFRNMQQSGSIEYATHKPHMHVGLVEVTGCSPDTLQLDIQLSTFLGVDPATELRRIDACEKRYVTMPLVVGNRPLGRYRWIITSHTVKNELYDGRGHLIGCDVSLKLTEYAR